MSKKNIKLGYEVETGEEVSISPSHLIVTGLSQKAGKTTTLDQIPLSKNMKPKPEDIMNTRMI